MEIISVLNWRYAVKHMDGKKVPQVKLDSILSAIRLAPTSLGVQPFHVFVIESKDVREKIFEKSCQQPQLKEGSHLLVFAARTSITDQEINHYIGNISDSRSVSLESLADFKAMIIPLKDYSTDAYTQWATRQAYISLGVGLVAAASLQVDATPIEGFDSESMDDLLGLSSKGLHSVVLMILGYRDVEKDYLAKAQKVRKPMTEVFTRI